MGNGVLVHVLHHDARAFHADTHSISAAPPPALADLRAAVRGRVTQDAGMDASRGALAASGKQAMPSACSPGSSSHADCHVPSPEGGVLVPVRLVPSTSGALPVQPSAFQGLESTVFQQLPKGCSQPSSLVVLADQRLAKLASLLQALRSAPHMEQASGSAQCADHVRPWDGVNEARLAALVKAKCGLLQAHKAQDVYRLGLLLDLLRHMPVTPLILAKCQIASVVKSLRCSSCPEIAACARSILSVWKKQVLACTTAAPERFSKQPSHDSALLPSTAALPPPQQRSLHHKEPPVPTLPPSLLSPCSPSPAPSPEPPAGVNHPAAEAHVTPLPNAAAREEGGSLPVSCEPSPPDKAHQEHHGSPAVCCKDVQRSSKEPKAGQQHLQVQNQLQQQQHSPRPSPPCLPSPGFPQQQQQQQQQQDPEHGLAESSQQFKRPVLPSSATGDVVEIPKVKHRRLCSTDVGSSPHTSSVRLPLPLACHLQHSTDSERTTQNTMVEVEMLEGRSSE